MKTFKRLITVVISLLFLSAKAEAQFFKKLGKTVKEVAAKTLSDDNANGTTTTGNSNDESVAVLASKPTNSTKSSFDFAKYNIKVSKAGTASFIKGDYFIESYSNVQVKDGQIFPTIVVGKMTEAEKLSELGEGSDKDVVFIYENGVKKVETTVGHLDKNLHLLNKKYDWYLVKEVANSGDDNKYVLPSKNKMAYTISFKGKTYGPYLMVSKMILNKAGTRFYATVSPGMKDLENEKTYLLSNDGKLKPIEFGGELLANIDFTGGCTIVSPVTSLISKMTKEEDEGKQEALQKQIADLMMNHPNESDVIFFNGKKLSNILTATPWLDMSGTNIFSIRVDASDKFPRGLYLNGKNIANAEPAQGQAWCNEDGSNWAYLNYYGARSELHLTFQDGTDVSSVIHPQQVVAGNKTFIVWFMYDRTKSDDISMCYKEL